MRVNHSGNNPVAGAEVSSAKKSGKAAQAEESKKGKEALSAEAVESSATTISSKGKDLARAKEVANAAPEVREEKIAELKRRIAAGTYKVNAEAVADKMVDEHLAMPGA